MLKKKHLMVASTSKSLFQAKSGFTKFMSFPDPENGSSQRTAPPRSFKPS
jgi:hypothetical protein